jgi:precorrin-6A/cobalt-precorrin-6A reductase
MSPSILILGGTTEASALAQAVAERGFGAVFSYAGRVGTPKAQPLPIRVGGFGGAKGLAAYLRGNAITHVIDATHPFAARMSSNAVRACAETDVALAAFSRPAWQPVKGDQWRHVADIDAAIAALDGAPKRVFLALGRMHLAGFAAQPQHRYLLRLVDDPGAKPLANCDVVVARGPFSCKGDMALMQQYDIQLVVSKNSGGTGARAKLDAARDLGLPVLMIDRPVLPARLELDTVSEVLDWLDHAGPVSGNLPGADRGV